MDFNLKEIKLFKELFENSKLSNRKLSKKVGFSKDTITKKIDLFLAQGIIKNFSLKVNYDLLNFKEYNLFIRLKNTSNISFMEIIEFLENHKNVTWIGKSFGKYDLKVSIILLDIKNINQIISQIHQKFTSNIINLDFLLVIDKYKVKSEFFFYHLFSITDSLNFETSSLSSLNLPFKKYKIDYIDKQLLFYLGQNPRLNYSKLALKLNLTAQSIKYRFKILKQNNIILGNSIVFDGKKFGKIWCTVLINLSLDKRDKFTKYIKNKPFLSSYVETIGFRNFAITFFASSIEELNNNLNAIRGEFSDDISDFDFLIFFDIYKYPKIPDCIFDVL